jgi:response regulator RpfG family c-di-GMP phosphodiesterase
MYEAYESKKSFFKDDVYVGFYESANKKTILLYLEGCSYLNDIDKNLLELFSNNISIAFDNLCLNDEIINTQSEIVKRLGGVIESRSKETADHVSRVAHTSYILAKAYGLSEEEATKIKLASPMHDIGKVAIPDEILLKPGKLTKEEFDKALNEAVKSNRVAILDVVVDRMENVLPMVPAGGTLYNMMLDFKE